MTIEEIRAIKAIDIHSHFGDIHGEMYRDTVEAGSEDYLLRTMALANIEISVNSDRYCIMPAGTGYSFEGNRRCLAALERMPGVGMWVTVDPQEPETFAQAKDFYSHPKVIGVKLHPQQHGYLLEEEGEKLFAFAASIGAPIMGHSGEDLCLPEVYVKFADRYPETTVVAAHLGCGYDGRFDHQICAIEMNRAGNLYTDTSSAQSLASNIIEYAVKRMGYDRLLFGTDSSNYFSPSQRIRIDMADIPWEAKAAILRGNAERLFPKLQNLRNFSKD
ncbi:MAG: amidohydrolase [Clostridia bacterium]|nr:amidohydrolase [Clostridia bacterium]